MSVSEAVHDLFVAFGYVGTPRHDAQAKLYVTELVRSIDCADCSADAVAALMRESKRLPALAQVLEAAMSARSGEGHYPHLSGLELGPASEAFWRVDAVNVIVTHVDGDRDLAAAIAAQMWWLGVEENLDRVDEEIRGGVWITAARRFTQGKDLPALVQASFVRARWMSEHRHDDAPIPRAILELDSVKASA